MNYLSLFSGIGGFEYGIQQSTKKDKLKCIGYSECKPYDGVDLGNSNGRGKLQHQSTNTLTCGGKIGVLIKDNSSKKAPLLKVGDTVDLSNSNASGKRVRECISPTLNTSKPPATLTEEYHLRRLTPVECERLQGYPDGWTAYGVDGSMISDTQRYKMLGNAVTTNVITHIMNTWNMKT